MNFTNEDYLNLFNIHGECDKAIYRKRDTFAPLPESITNCH